MTRNQMDAQVAANIGCTASYVTAIRLNRDAYKSDLAERVKHELDRVQSEYQEFRHRVKDLSPQVA